MLNEDSGWSDSDVQTAVLMWTEKKSSTEIGAAINKTRNAVIGKMNRIGCIRGYGILTPEQLQVAQAAEAESAAEVEPEPPLPPPPPEPVAPTAEGVLFLNATSMICRFPLWKEGTPISRKFVCGKPVAKETISWCEHHAKVCFDPQKPRRR